MKRQLVTRLVVASALMTLVGLGFVIWGLLGHGPIPIFMSMTLGQGIGMCAIALYVFVVFTELWNVPIREAKAAPEAAPEPEPEQAAPEAAP